LIQPEPADTQFTVSGGYVYIMTNRPHGILYVGVTSDLERGRSSVPVMVREGGPSTPFFS